MYIEFKKKVARDWKLQQKVKVCNIICTIIIIINVLLYVRICISPARIVLATADTLLAQPQLSSYLQTQINHILKDLIPTLVSTYCTYIGICQSRDLFV